ncbi:MULTISPECIES: DUF4249 family protein [unclassified Croceitalea]|uniref:DUF4249 family protein n=1 Tax=unclassified Croceitalea TaxID=2632280 RepID=UPI0030DB1B5A
MKKIPYYFILFFLTLSCEDVIEVNLPSTESKLVVDALFRVDVAEEYVPVEVKTTVTTSFFEQSEPTQLSSAIIFYGIPLEDDPSLFEEVFSSSLAESEPGSGIYIPDPNFDGDQRISTSILEPGMVFQLIIEHEGKRYFATTTYVTVPPIDNIEQGTNTLFDEEDIEILVTFTDVPDIENYYIFDFDFNEFLALDDQFIDGQQFEFSYFYDKSLEPGDEVEISILGADQPFFNYMDLLLEQTEDTGGVFETPAATVRGNVFDITGLDNINIFDNVERPESFALGYFAVVQEFKQSITIE